MLLRSSTQIENLAIAASAVFPFWVTIRLMTIQVLSFGEPAEPFSILLAIVTFVIFSAKVLTNNKRRMAHAAGSLSSFIFWLLPTLFGVVFNPLQLFVYVVGIYALLGGLVIAIYLIDGKEV